MRFSAEMRITDSERLERAFAKRAEQIADRVAKLGADNARRDAGNRTPGTTYEGTHSQSGPTSYTFEVWADPRSEGADINLRIALGGRKAYTITPKRKKVLAWPGDDGMAYSKKVSKPAIAPINGGDFIRKAVARAVQRVKNDYS